MNAKGLLACCLLLSAGVVAAAESMCKPTLMFRAGSSNEFSFNTGLLEGTLRAGGASKGLSRVVHVPTGTSLDASMGLFGLYRILGENERYGDAAWNWPSEAKLEQDGSVAVHWPVTNARPFELHAVYRWTSPDTLELETSLKPAVSLKKIEVFLAAYCSAGFTNAAVWAGSANGFMAALPQYGKWLAFPRDEAAFGLIHDGRWTHPPSPVDWVRVADYRKPLAIRRDPTSGLALVIMGDPKDCFAVLTPEQGDTHRSLYFSLFGRDADPGDVLRARTCLVINTNLSDSAAMRLWEKHYSRANF